MKPIIPGWPSDSQLVEFHNQHFNKAIRSQFERALRGEIVPVIHPSSLSSKRQHQNSNPNRMTNIDDISLCTRCKTYMSYSIWYEHQTTNIHEEEDTTHATHANDDDEEEEE